MGEALGQKRRFDTESPGRNLPAPISVGQRVPNLWGLHDMGGNAAEWVQDLYGKDYYKSSPEKDPKGPKTGETRVARLGGHVRLAVGSASWDPVVGLRLTLDPDAAGTAERAGKARAEKAASAKAAPAKPAIHTNSIGMKFAHIPAGTFQMGCDEQFAECRENETPRHEVTISRPFHIGQYQVTQAQWAAVMGYNPVNYSAQSGPDHPVAYISWPEAQGFIALLNAREGHYRYRLPTEAEWEYAVRAGMKTRYFWGDDLQSLDRYAWIDASDWHPVGLKEPNPWGLYDIYGECNEWMLDRYGKYGAGPEVDPRGASEGDDRVVRGGVEASRHRNDPDRRRSKSDHEGVNRSATGLRITLEEPDAANARPQPALTAKLESYTNSIGMEFLRVPAGTFKMGCDAAAENVERCLDKETPSHEVRISRDFWLGKYEVTREQWAALTGGGRSYQQSLDGSWASRHPVTEVSWNAVQEFINLLNEKEGHKRYRLPTEAEWEYAARAGTSSAWFFGNDPGDQARYMADRRYDAVVPVGAMPPNSWGFHDMHGNAREWVQDWYAEDYYQNSPDLDPQGPEKKKGADQRVLRGGRSAERQGHYFKGTGGNIGFRLVLEELAGEEDQPKPVVTKKLKPYTNSFGMEFLRVPAGVYQRGCDPAGEQCPKNETPRREVRISRDFYLGTFEVTREQWDAVMNDRVPETLKVGDDTVWVQAISNPDNRPYLQGRKEVVTTAAKIQARCPVTATWHDAQKFIDRLNEKEGHKRYRLPTEAEWEYAARAGTTAAWPCGNDANGLGRCAIYRGNSGQPFPVGSREPNPWGFYDMYGNVWEWVQDWYAEDYYQISPSLAPRGPETGSVRGARGGSFKEKAPKLRSTHRDTGKPDYHYDSVGFRVAMTAE